MNRHRIPHRIILSLALIAPLLAGAPASAAHWKPLPLWGGEVALAAPPGDAPVVYAASWSAGLYESVDAGSSWRFVSRGPNHLPLRILGVDPHQPRRLYVTSEDRNFNYRGFFRSEDGGRHWQRSDLEMMPVVVNQVAFDPETPGVVFAATSKGLYRSHDRGDSWQRLAFADRWLARVWVAPSAPDVVLVSVADENSWSTQRSSDGGTTFAEVFDDLLDGIVFDPVRPQRAYGFIYRMFLQSDDLGATWSRNDSLGAMALAVTRSGVLVAGNTTPGIRRSLDGGATWGPLEPPPADYAGSLVALGDYLLAGGLRGVWRSRTEGREWEVASTGLGAHWVSALAVGEGSTLWAGTQSDFFTSRDGGATFQSLFAEFGPIGYGSIELLAVPPQRPEVAYLYGARAEADGTSPRGLMLTEDGGGSWRRLPYPGTLLTTVLAIDPEDPDLIYAGGSVQAQGNACTALRSTDGGETWSCMSPLTGRNLTALAIDPRDARNLYAVAGEKLFRSKNRGVSWTRVRTRTTGIVRLEVDPFRAERLHALAGNQLLRSDDGGRTWTATFTVRQPAAMRDLLLDPERPGRIWATAELFAVSGATASTSRVFRSDDAGRHWRQVSDGLRAGTVILDLVAAPSSADVLYAGTAGQGLLRLDPED